MSDRIDHSAILDDPAHVLGTAMAADEPSFKEPLPDDCPPCAATHLEPQILLRLVPGQDVQAKDFLSQMALGYELAEGEDPCSYSSCSMYLENKKRHELTALLRYPKLRHLTWVAHVQVDQSSGKAKVGKRSRHVDLWMYHDYDPVGSTKKVEKL